MAVLFLSRIENHLYRNDISTIFEWKIVYKLSKDLSLPVLSFRNNEGIFYPRVWKQTLREKMILHSSEECSPGHGVVTINVGYH